MIEAPKEDKRKAALRTLVEALAQGTAITAGLAHLYRFTFPSQMEKDLEAWRQEITDAVNDHDRLLLAVETKLLPRSAIGQTALAIAFWLSKSSTDGLEGVVQFDDLLVEFAEIDKGELEEACFELQAAGLVETSAVWGYQVHTLSPTYALFWALDPTVIGTDPLSDARLLAIELIADQSMGNVRKLDARMGWPRRRLNPALAHLLPLIRVKSREIQPDYPVTFLSIESEERFKLKLFLQ